MTVARQWLCLLENFVPLPEKACDVPIQEIQHILALCENINVALSTALFACDLFLSYRNARTADERKFDNHLLTITCLCLACEIHEGFSIEYKDLCVDLEEITQEQHSIRTTEAAICIVQCEILSAIQFGCLAQSRLIDFYSTVMDSFALTRIEKNAVNFWVCFSVLFGFNQFAKAVAAAYLFACNREKKNGCVCCNVRRFFGYAIDCVVVLNHCKILLRKALCINVFPDILAKQCRFVWSANDLTDLENATLCRLCLHEQYDRHDLQCRQLASKKVLPFEISCINFQKKLSLIASGTYGHVYHDVARKECIKVFKDEQFAREICVAQALDHHALLKFVKCGYDALTQRVWVSSQHYGCGDLKRMIEDDSEPISSQLVARIVFGVAQALDHMHKNNFIHCDVKPSNVICSRDGGIVKLFDFSLSQRLVGSGKTNKVLSFEMINTITYRPPELLVRSVVAKMAKKPIYGYAADIWAFGLLFYQLLDERHRVFPHPSETDPEKLLIRIFRFLAVNIDMQQYVADGASVYKPQKCLSKWDDLIESVGLSACDLLSAMLQINAEKRISAALVQQHPYFDALRAADWSD